MGVNFVWFLIKDGFYLCGRKFCLLGSCFEWEIEFLNGEKYIFGGNGYFMWMEDCLGNWVNFNMLNNVEWIIFDKYG